MRTLDRGLTGVWAEPGTGAGIARSFMRNMGTATISGVLCSGKLVSLCETPGSGPFEYLDMLTRARVYEGEGGQC
ncbi:hypothetical protein GCM10010279_67580 [Streptomyces mutabilis]|nr:hypothetical protein GCM10010279_67580 [Streptomyces mutabilis]